MKITIYELLGMIKDGKTPKKIKYDGEIFEYINDCRDYKCYDDSYYLFSDLFAEHYDIQSCLNEELEIIDEENKIEKIDITDKSICVKGTRFFRDKDIEIFQKLSMVINELIDEVNKLKEE